MIKRKDGRWQEQVKLPGMQKPKYFYGKTKSEVTRKIAAFRQEQEKGPLFETCVDQWEIWHEGQISVSSAAAYRTQCKDAKTFFSGRYLREIGADDVAAYAHWLVDRDYAKSTIAGRMTCLHMIFDYAIINKYCLYNPCSAVKLPRGLREKKRTVPEDSVLEAVERAEKSGGGLFAYILLYTGLRRGELLGLRWEDVDFAQKEIHVRRSVYFLGGSPHIKEPKTEAGVRTVGLLDRLEAVLLPAMKSKGYLFGGERPLTNAEYQAMWRRFISDNGLMGADGPLLTPHQLRHAFATILFEAGVTEKDAQETLGHASIQMTRDVYTHIRKDRRKQSVERVNAWLDGCQSCAEDGKVVDIKGIL